MIQIRSKKAINFCVLVLLFVLESCTVKNPYLPKYQTGEEFYKTVSHHLQIDSFEDDTFGRLVWLDMYYFTGMKVLNNEIVNQRLAARQFANEQGGNSEKYRHFEDDVVTAYERIMEEFGEYMFDDYVAELKKLDGKELYVNLVQKGLNGATATAHLAYVKEPETLKEGVKDWIGRHKLKLVVTAQNLNDSPMAASFVNCENKLVESSYYIAQWFDKGEITKEYTLAPRILYCCGLYITREHYVINLEDTNGAGEIITNAYGEEWRQNSY